MDRQGRLLSAAFVGHAGAAFGEYSRVGYERRRSRRRTNVENVQSPREDEVAAPSAGVKRRTTAAAGTRALLRRLTRSRRAQLGGDEVVLAHDSSRRLRRQPGP